MAVKEIVLYPNPILKAVCQPFEQVDEVAQRLGADLVDTMRASPGVGLAAPQIGVAQRMIAVDVTPKNPGHGLLVLLNPELISSEGSKVGREGCLSIPDFTANVRRAERVVIRALTLEGEIQVFESTGFEAVCLQHEIDHLDGVLFLDRVVCLKSDVFRRKGVKPRFDPEQYATSTP